MTLEKDNRTSGLAMCSAALWSAGICLQEKKAINKGRKEKKKCKYSNKTLFQWRLMEGFFPPKQVAVKPLLHPQPFRLSFLMLHNVFASFCPLLSLSVLCPM